MTNSVRLTNSSRPTTPLDDSRADEIVEPAPAHLVHKLEARNAAVIRDSPPTVQRPARPDDLFHSLSDYSIEKNKGQYTPQDEAELDPRSVGFVNIKCLGTDLPSGGFAEPPPPVHERQSDSRFAGAGARLQSIAASIILPVQLRGPRRVSRLSSSVRKTSIYQLYEKSKVRGIELRRKRWVQVLFEYTFYLLLICFAYFLLIGVPLWRGACAWLYYAVKVKFSVTAGFVIVVALAAIYAFAPLLLLLEKDPPPVDDAKSPGHNSANIIQEELGTALLIPCYKSGDIIGATLEAALKVFPPAHIFVIANGNSPTPLDKTEDVCMRHHVNHIWSPVGSKIVAQFVGCYAAKAFKYVLLIDDDCLIPPNFPIVSDRLTGRVKSIGYMIKSVGPNRSKGNWCQQAQDMEYKVSGLQRAFAGVCGSATFPHGAISLWDREFLLKVFHDHPGFSISEDWFFGHSCRKLGGRIKMCSAVFVETETPPALFFASGASRGGFGEMTVFKQRFTRWNFFFVTGLWYNISYIFGSWKLGWWEIGAKLAVFQEVYETLLYLFTPFVLPMSIVINPEFWGFVFVGTMVLYLLNVAIFNEIQLRLKKERVSWSVLIVYYTAYKIIFAFVNVASCYWSIYKYARYFARRYPKIVEDEKAVEVVLMMDEPDRVDSVTHSFATQGRRFTVTTVPARADV
ncbi:Nucleotide-diphospho-sugar transferase [Coniochaeta hoffmannii]|uniref:Nucleotide-diphospho-sugar transferase n=1 Tax=Coniochaeta hoffmannii TaxID=91930 RepID=A0AA38RV83_9PEZI|nr:Nucleotide-diphospho-sugar transferase [Coniochaeta hoffmannii]